ncbi:hypothetical protein [Aureivirga sp. CE67]|uniref:hypothetical protein n=1 Tax=Aureivirga sp. CE67 TaxID=1788983 RepID=UPI0018CA2394|nr:hypothetical protein [Aureivirga sp. CE67]
MKSILSLLAFFMLTITLSAQTISDDLIEIQPPGFSESGSFVHDGHLIQYEGNYSVWETTTYKIMKGFMKRKDKNKNTKNYKFMVRVYRNLYGQITSVEFVNPEPFMQSPGFATKFMGTLDQIIIILPPDPVE